MKKLILFLVPTLAFASPDITQAPFPVFLKIGYSSVLEFSESPTRVVLGDSQAFQVERLEKSLVVRTLLPYASSNMFVYFKTGSPKIFTLTASEDSNPTFHRSFEETKPETQTTKLLQNWNYKRETRLIRASFDSNKDYLTVEISISADSKEAIRPRWSWVRLAHDKDTFVPVKLWAERESVQKDSTTKARFIFKRPNVPRNLSDTHVVIPILGYASPIRLPLNGKGSK